MNLPMDFRGGIDRLPSMLEGIVARINTLWNKQHKLDGGHGAVTAVKITAAELDIGDYTGLYDAHKGKPLVGTGKQAQPVQGEKPEFTSALSIGQLTLVGDEGVEVSAIKRIAVAAGQDVVIETTTGQRPKVAVDAVSVTVTGRLNVSRNPHALNSEGDTHGALVLTTRNEPANNRKWRIYNYLRRLYFGRINDAEDAYVDGPEIYFTPAGQIQAAGLGTTPINGANIIPGTLPIPPLPTTIAYVNAQNPWTAVQVLPSTSGVSGANGQFWMTDTSAPVNAQHWRLLGYSNGNLYIESLNPGVQTQFYFTRAGMFGSSSLSTGSVSATTTINAGGTITGGALTTAGQVTCSHVEATYHLRAGTGVYAGTDFYERGRAYPQGHWINQPYVAAHFYGSGGMTVDVQPGNYQASAYMLVGMTLTWTLYVAAAALGTAAGTTIYITLPGGFAGLGFAMAVGELHAPSEGWMPCYVGQEAGRVAVTKFNKLAFAGTAPLYIRFTIQIQIG